MNLSEYAAVARDVVDGKPPDNHYSARMVALHDEISTEWAAAKKVHPGAVLWIPSDVEGLPDAEDDDDTEDVVRTDYDPDQPRDEQGRFGSGGGASASAPPKGETGASTPGERNARALKLGVHTASAVKALAAYQHKSARIGIDSAFRKQGFAPRNEGTENVMIDDRLDHADGVHSADGLIRLCPAAASSSEKFAKSWSADPDGVKAKLQSAPKAINDPETRALVDQLYGAHVLAHETAHCFGPIHQHDREGTGIAVEEVTTESATRAYIRDEFGFDTQAAHEAVHPYGYDVFSPRPEWQPAAPYQIHIDRAAGAIAQHYGVPRLGGYQILEAASKEFKAIPPRPLSYGKWPEMRSYAERNGTLPDFEKRYGAEPVVRPLDLFSQVVEAVYERGPGGTGKITPKETDTTRGLARAIDRSWAGLE